MVRSLSNFCSAGVVIVSALAMPSRSRSTEEDQGICHDVCVTGCPTNYATYCNRQGLFCFSLDGCRALPTNTSCLGDNGGGDTIIPCVGAP
jgi:hypothetical protein